MDNCSPEFSTLGLWVTGHLDAWTLGPWTLEIFSIFSETYFFFILFNVEFLNIFKAVGLMCYGSPERAAVGYCNSNQLQLMLPIKFPNKAT